MTDLTPNELKLFQFLKQNGAPANQDQISSKCTFEEDAHLEEALNGLLRKSRVEIFQKGKVPYFSAVAETEVAHLKT